MFIEKIVFENNFPQNLVVQDLSTVITKPKEKQLTGPRELSDRRHTEQVKAKPQEEETKSIFHDSVVFQ
jgi:hypothetical protein